MTRLCAVLALLLAATLAPPARAAERWVPDQGQCDEEGSTQDMVACAMDRTKIWDARLNKAYAHLTALYRDPDQQPRLEPLLLAQRAWIKYRDANCAYYASHDGSIRMVAEAECMRRMTQDRAIELQDAAGE